MTPRETEDWDLVVEYTHPSSARGHSLPTMVYEQIYLLGDGYGKIDRRFAREQCYDWSHVRDSSPEAIKAMAKSLRFWLGAAAPVRVQR